ncbi:ImmA/IrrE family metallo-endopeptidase [Corynebacterium glucuronolyticum]|uniref:ImmA/IrrE family metallo-endopeptidase n=2 Tax=Corynebacterium glucuronolyticum TaxID=39791 RepID=A0AAX1L7L0_9CORY|nr:ImmA/IrrE family metallo-endopeptidase [Corynebacterium glucuronolyticum]EEI64392.1 hypothetical protein HMPREF0293_0110 [Corynebacterium glucuronolyticum ATCC 51866]QRP70397.1 ImmA/IrrE family metallo-endopeptidase [Corynebacterium glucuronolyticum]
MGVEVAVQPDVLNWALERSELSEETIAKRFPQMDDWMSGVKNPTLVQANEIANAARLPLGRLLLDVPTPEKIAIPDFRTVRNAPVETVGANPRDMVKTAEYRLGWYAEYASDIGIEPPRVLGIASAGSKPDEAASKVRDTFGWDDDGHPRGRDKVLDLSNRMEEHGLLVMRNSIVDNSTRRKLKVSEFRGFTLCQGEYALVFVNTSDSKTAQLFSLAHELGHVSRSAPGLSGDQGKENPIEQWCNAFAASLLMPEPAVRRFSFEPENLVTQLGDTAPRFGVSREALLWRIVDLGIVSQQVANSVVGLVKGHAGTSKPKGTGAPQFRVLVRSRVGRRFLTAITEATQAGYLSETDAAGYLGVKKQDTLEKVMSSIFAPESTCTQRKTVRLSQQSGR